MSIKDLIDRRVTDKSNLCKTVTEGLRRLSEFVGGTVYRRIENL